uniref:Uncharacterized protein n=1 Tax=Arundo donax TaxID=35708 RepID=A0A0A9HAJ6_ARUDO
MFDRCLCHCSFLPMFDRCLCRCHKWFLYRLLVIPISILICNVVAFYMSKSEYEFERRRIGA